MSANRDTNHRPPPSANTDIYVFDEQNFLRR